MSDWKPTEEMMRIAHTGMSVENCAVPVLKRALIAVQPLMVQQTAAETWALAAQVARDCPLPSDPHSDAWTLGFLRAKSTIAATLGAMVKP